MNKMFAIVPLASGAFVSAYAAVPASVSGALDTIGADALTVATVVLVAIVTLYAFKFLRKGL